MSRLSIICVYNDEGILKDYLLNGLEAQKMRDYDLVLIENCDQKYTSAAAALTDGVKRAKSDNLVFTHHDIRMEKDDVLDSIASYFDSGLAFFGSSGVRLISPLMQSTIDTSTHDQKYYANRFTKRIAGPTEVQALDECFFCITRSAFDSLGGFDTELCDNWHMYSVELCMHAKKEGMKIYAVPLALLHKSGGTISKAFIKNLRSVCKKYHKLWVCHPCYHFFAFPPFMWLLYAFWQITYSRKKAGDQT